MNKTVAALEITSRHLKLNIGYYNEDKIHLLYSHVEDISEYMDHYKILNEEKLISRIKSLTQIKDDAKRIKFNIKEIVLVLPSVGLDVYQIEKRSKIISPSGVIEKSDIESVVTQISTEPLNTPNQVLVDVIPYRFTIDEGKAFTEPPLGQKTSIMNVAANVYALPSDIVSSYRKVIHQAGIKIKKMTIAPLNAAELMIVNKQIEPNQTYIYLDIRSDMSVLSLIRKNLVYESSFFLKGINDIDKEISNGTGLSLFVSGKIRHANGFSLKSKDIDIKIRTKEDDELVTYSFNEYNEILRASLINYCKDLKTCINNLFVNYKDKEKCYSLPLIIGGEGANMLGMLDAIKLYIKEPESIVKAKTKVVGANSLEFVNTLGAIYSATVYRGSYQDQALKVTHIEREEEKAPTPEVEGKEVL